MVSVSRHITRYLKSRRSHFVQSKFILNLYLSIHMVVSYSLQTTSLYNDATFPQRKEGNHSVLTLKITPYWQKNSSQCW